MISQRPKPLFLAACKKVVRFPKPSTEGVEVEWFNGFRVNAFGLAIGDRRLSLPMHRFIFQPSYQSQNTFSDQQNRFLNRKTDFFAQRNGF
jgi:hypothetical protein